MTPESLVALMVEVRCFRMLDRSDVDRADSVCAKIVALNQALAAERAAREKAERERDHWKANHDNAVAIRRSVLSRPDLSMHVHPEREEFKATLAAAIKRAEAAERRAETAVSGQAATDELRCRALDRAEAAEAKLAALQRRTDRHDHAKNLGQAVEGDAEIMARLTAERDAARAEADGFRSLIDGYATDATDSQDRAEKAEATAARLREALRQLHRSECLNSGANQLPRPGCDCWRCNNARIIDRALEGAPSADSGWIACSERMPTPPADKWDMGHDEYFFVARRDGLVSKARPEYAQDDEMARAQPTGRWFTDGEGWDLDNVTHWMPLPAHPNVKPGDARNPERIVSE